MFEYLHMMTPSVWLNKQLTQDTSNTMPIFRKPYFMLYFVFFNEKRCNYFFKIFMVFVPAIVVVMVVLCVQKVNFDIMVKYLGHTFTYREFIEISTTSPWRYQSGAWH